jgi:hypothetical protein
MVIMIYVSQSTWRILMIFLGIIRMMSLHLNDFMGTGSLKDSFWEVLKHRNRNLIESNEIIPNFVALEGYGEGGGLKELACS